jgi:hypothetical protein
MVNANELILVFYNTLDCINSVATEKRDLETVKVKLSDLLYLTIVHVFVLSRNIISINTYTNILICDFLIFCLMLNVYPFMSYPWYVTTVNIGPQANLFWYSFVWVSNWEIWSRSQPMNFLMCSFANHDSLHPWLSQSNNSLCSSKYSDIMDICCNTWKWAQRNKFGPRVIAFFPMSLFLWAFPHDETWEHQLGYWGQRNLGPTQWLPLYSILVPCCPKGMLDFQRTTSVCRWISHMHTSGDGT